MSLKQLTANRINSGKSTGPKTEGGKQSSSKNSLKHGLLSRQTFLPNENPIEFEKFFNDLWDSLKPDGHLEALLMDRIITNAWRLRRVTTLDVAMMKASPFDEDTDLASGFRTNADRFSILSRYEVALERSFYRSLQELVKLQSLRPRDIEVLPVFENDMEPEKA